MIPYFAHMCIELAIGIAAGWVLYWMTHETTPSGVLKIDLTDPETDRYLLVFTVPLEELPSKKRVLIAIDPDAKIPRSATGRVEPWEH